MVREARFSWDETDHVQIPHRSSEFDGLDDLMLDDLSRLNPRQKTVRREDGKQPREKSPRGDSRRHLAGADWMTDKSVSTPSPIDQCPGGTL